MKTTMTDVQANVLKQFADNGGLLLPKEEIRADCKALCALKYLRPQPILDGKSMPGSAKINVAYQVTRAGRKAAGVD